MVFENRSAPPSSVTSERLCSTAGRVYHENRNQLNPDTAGNLILFEEVCNLENDLKQKFEISNKKMCLYLCGRFILDPRTQLDFRKIQCSGAGYLAQP